jgi:uncharacterized SAM-binding protein YcdF (DUF218 family)
LNPSRGCLSRGIFALLATIGFVVAIVTATPVTAWYSRLLSGPFSEPRARVLVVLGGSSLEPGLIGEDSYWRAVYAVRAYRKWPYPRIILSGAGAAEPMREFLVAMGVPAGVIQVEARSHSTRENALFVKQLLGGTAGEVALLTSDYHMFRASRVFAKVGFKVAPYPIPNALKLGSQWRTRWPAFLDEMSELAKIVYYTGRGWM